MEFRSLRQVIEDAENQVDTYKYPDLSEFRERFDPIVKAGKFHIVLSDRISYVRLSSRGLDITTDYSLRGCSMSDDVTIPLSVIDATDPVHEARRQYLDNEVKKLQSQLADHRNQIDRITVALVKAQVEYEEHTHPN